MIALMYKDVQYPDTAQTIFTLSKQQRHHVQTAMRESSLLEQKTPFYECNKTDLGLVKSKATSCPELLSLLETTLKVADQISDLFEITAMERIPEITCPFDTSHIIGGRVWKITSKKNNESIYYSDAIDHLIRTHSFLRVESSEIPFNLTLFFTIFPKQESAYPRITMTERSFTYWQAEEIIQNGTTEAEMTALARETIKIDKFATIYIVPEKCLNPLDENCENEWSVMDNSNTPHYCFFNKQSRDKQEVYQLVDTPLSYCNQGDYKLQLVTKKTNEISEDSLNTLKTYFS